MRINCPNFIKNTANSIFSKKFLLQFYFIFFIFINIIDFLNIIGGDLDFFKKILSWILIAYIFYQVSFTKIWIGERLKIYDIVFIIVFCILVIPKSIFLYSSTIPFENLNSLSNFELGKIDNYYIFSDFLGSFKSEISNSNKIILFAFAFSLISQIILIIALLNNYEIKEKSLIGSFKLRDSYLGIVIKFVLAVLISFFFGLIIFNLFMEWFALAVDAIILVLGLIYYLFKYIKNHMEGKFSLFLSNVSNSGNTFFQNLISMFSDKRTLFVGIAFLLVLHSLVDCGVYLIPYSIGTQNTLYFSSLDTQDRMHKSLFGFNDLKESLIYHDLVIDQNVKGDLLLSLGVVLIYLFNIFLFFSLLILPFWIFYRNVQKKELIFNKIFICLFLLSVIFYLVLNFNFPFSDLNNPIQIGKPQDETIRGVDIYTQSISSSINGFSLLISLLLFLLLGFLFILLHNKFENFFIKSTYVIVLLFFIFYLILFFTSTIETDYNNLKTDANIEAITGSNYENFSKYETTLQIYENESYYVDKRTKMDLNNNIFEANFIAFSDLKNPLSSNKLNITHNDYLYIIVKNCSLKTEFDLRPEENYYFKNNVYNDFENKFREKNFEFIYYLGENKYILNKSNKRTILNLNITEFDLKNILKLKQKENILDKTQRIIEILRFTFMSIFYIFGTIAFSFYYIRKNLLER